MKQVLSTDYFNYIVKYLSGINNNSVDNADIVFCKAFDYILYNQNKSDKIINYKKKINMVCKFDGIKIDKDGSIQGHTYYIMVPFYENKEDYNFLINKIKERHIRVEVADKIKGLQIKHKEYIFNVIDLEYGYIFVPESEKETKRFYYIVKLLYSSEENNLYLEVLLVSTGQYNFEGMIPSYIKINID